MVAAAVVVLGGVAFAGVMVVKSLAASPDVLSKMVPASDQAYVTAFLDPGTGQKLHLHDLLGRFPALQGKDPVKTLEQFLEEQFRPTGLSYLRDVKPWLGSQIGVAGRMNDSGEPDAAVMIVTKDDEQALTAFHRLEGLSDNAGLLWRTEPYRGIDIRVGEQPGGNGFGHAAAYAVVDHVAVVGTSLARVQGVIDADQGRTDTLAGDANFQKSRDALPDDVLGMAYVNIGDILDKAIPSLEAGLGFADLPPGCGSDQIGRSLDAARAIRGLALSVTAESDGAALDMGLTLDRSLLPGGDQALIAGENQRNTVLSFAPNDAMAVFGITGAQGLDAGIDQLGKCQPGVQEQLDRFGVKDILQNLSGDIGVELHQVSSTDAPVAAVVAGVKDEGKMQASLDHLAQQLAQESGSSASPTSEDYHGVTIKSVEADPSIGLAPAWAVTDGVAILATTPDEVRAAIDAHSGNDVTAAPNFQAAAARVQLDNQEVLYVDVGAVLDAVEAQTSPDALGEFRRVTENVRPVKATILTAATDGDVIKVRWFFLIP
ncbi:MAG: DUF3352 domain-containing protein [Actinomycetota bacterium]